MTSQEKIELLQRYRHELAEIEYIEGEILFWRSKAEKMTVCYGGYQSSGGKNLQPIENAVIHVDALIQQLANRVKQTAEYRLQIENALKAVPDAKLRRLLYCRYVTGETWEKIAESMAYSVRNMQRLHSIALDLLELE